MSKVCPKCGKPIVEGDAVAGVSTGTYREGAQSLTEGKSSGLYHQSCHNKAIRTFDSIMDELREQSKVGSNK